ncbi:MAG TPA: hypothetical protein VMU83_11045 [Hanamia sp.]|nr:hypothetical protein [Hanamia sp.]
MDDLKLLSHPTQEGENEGAWYGDIWVTGNTCNLIIGAKSLVRLAKLFGDNEMAARRQAFISS